MMDPTYALGRTDDGHARLTEQANFIRPLTERLFKTSGIAPGMKVLDVGSGVGDVAFLVAELVGPHGSVVGVDMDATALEKGRKRAEQLKLRNVEFIHGDIRTTTLRGPFDAAVGLGKPELLGEFVVGGGPDFAGYPWLANTIRSLAPMARKLGISLETLGDLDTFVERLRSEAATERRDFWSPPYVGAFVRVASPLDKAAK